MADSICEKLKTFHSVCSDENYWKNLYKTEFSEYSEGSREIYFNGRNELDTSNDYDVTILDRGWEKKFIPMVHGLRERDFSPQYVQYLLRYNLTRGHIHIIKYLVEVKHFNLNNGFLQLYLTIISYRGDLPMLKYFIQRHIVSLENKRLLTHLLHRALIPDPPIMYDETFYSRRREFVNYLIEHGDNIERLTTAEQQKVHDILK